MNIDIMQNQSNNNVVSKSIAKLITVAGTIKNNTSIVDPVFLVRLPNRAQATSCNYLYVPDFGRYYFVQDIESIRNDLWEFTCHVDVLQTYRNEIKAQTAVIARQENEYNTYLPDDHFKSYQNNMVVTKEFPTGFTNPSYVLTVAGG